MGRKKKTYSNEFKRRCLSELMDGEEFSKVCTDNDVAPSTLSDWKKSFLQQVGSRETKAQEKKLEEMGKKFQKAKQIIGKKEMEIELLKKLSCSEQEGPVETR